MTSINEAYLPINLDFINNSDNKSDSLYLKEIYAIVDSLPLDKLNIEEYDPELLKQECEKYKNQLTKYSTLFKQQQLELKVFDEKIETLTETKKKFEDALNDENITNTLVMIDELIDHIKIKQECLKNEHQRTALEYKYLFSIGPHYTQNDPRHLCPICVSNEVDTAIVPCGHTVCGKCSIKCDISMCYVCRNQIEKVIKLYYI